MHTQSSNPTVIDDAVYLQSIWCCLYWFYLLPWLREPTFYTYNPTIAAERTET